LGRGGIDVSQALVVVAMLVLEDGVFALWGEKVQCCKEKR
jgi:hypothetical protein